MFGKIQKFCVTDMCGCDRLTIAGIEQIQKPTINCVRLVILKFFNYDYIKLDQA